MQASYVHDLAQHFKDGKLSDELLAGRQGGNEGCAHLGFGHSGRPKAYRVSGAGLLTSVRRVGYRQQEARQGGPHLFRIFQSHKSSIFIILLFSNPESWN
jgi:hypothetical protein